MNKLNWSRFNFLIQTDNNHKYLYNSYTNGLIELDEALFTELNNMAERQSISETDLSHLSQSEIIYLKNNYILVEDDNILVDIMHHQSLARIYSKKHLVLTIAPTQSCNFNCSYCYEQWRKSGSMTDDTENSIINYITEKQITDGLESISLTWYGGEPLLQHKRVISLAKRINELGLKIYENEIITNGYFLTLDIIELLIEANITSVQVTLDGVKEAHDARRPLLSGKGTFDTILNNLDNYFESKYKDSLLIAIRVNIDRNNHEKYIEIYKWLKNRYKSAKKLVIYPGIIVLDEEDREHSVCLSRKEVADMFISLYKEYGIISESLYPDNINMECMIRKPNSMLIGSQGEIYKCYEDLGNKKLIVGNINNSKIWNNIELIAKYSVGIDHYNDPACKLCNYLPICSGGCPIRRLENKYMNKSNDCCTSFKNRIKDYIELYSKLKQ